MRLVVGDDDGRLLEVFAILILQMELHTGQQLQSDTHKARDDPMETVAFLLGVGSQDHIHQGERCEDEEGEDKEDEER